MREIPSGFKFTATVDEEDYVFQTQEDLNGVDDGNGFYEFQTANASNIISIFEGTAKTKTFLITE